jgi:hypothetical protein
MAVAGCFNSTKSASLHLDLKNILNNDMQNFSLRITTLNVAAVHGKHDL